MLNELLLQGRAVLPSELPLVGHTDPAPAGELGARVSGRCLEVPLFVVAWAKQRGFLSGGRLLAALELQPARVAGEWGWSPTMIAGAATQLRELFSRWP